MSCHFFETDLADEKKQREVTGENVENCSLPGTGQGGTTKPKHIPGCTYIMHYAIPVGWYVVPVILKSVKTVYQIE